MCKICVSVGETSCEHLIDDANEAFRLGADIVELRLDHIKDEKLTEEVLDKILSRIYFDRKRILITIRPVAHSGKYEGNENDRKKVFEHAIEKGVGYIDIERRSEILSSIVSLIKNSKEPKPKLIVSEHGLGLPKKDVVKAILDDAFAKGADIAKGAFPVTTLEELSSIYDTLDEISKIYEGRYTVMGMGQIGSSVRIMAPRYKMALVYACLPSKPLVEGQIPITKLERIWRILGLIRNVR